MASNANDNRGWPALRQGRSWRAGRRLARLAALLALGGCTNINQMYQQYQQGDEAQLERIMEIVSRPDYPYATRRKAAYILGEIGDPRAVPVLSMALRDYEQRTTLKQEAIRALGKIGDPAAVGAIGRLLDRSLDTADADLRMTAVEALGQIGGEKSAEILVNALRYYDLVMLRAEQRNGRGIFSGEKQSPPFGPAADTLGRGRRRPGGPGGLGGFFGDYPQISMFGTQIAPEEMRYNPTPAERQQAHAALVGMGRAALPPIERFLGSEDMSPTLRRELLDIMAEINGAPPAAE